VKLAIVAYPGLDDFDRRWIEAFRTEHDPQAARIAVHFTLVFPLDAAAHDVETELREAARSTQRIRFVIRRTEVVHDTAIGATHILLVPDDGGTHIVELHDRLYAGRLRAHLRSDIRFVPHMTVGATPDSFSADRLVSERGIRSRIVHGTIDRLNLVEVAERQVRTVATYALGN
jgi:2'-5' RNA ligase